MSMGGSEWMRPGGSRGDWCARLDEMFRAGKHDELIEALMPEIRGAAVRVRGLTREQRKDVIGETVVFLLEEWARGKTYGDSPIVAVARKRVRFIALDLFGALDEPRRRGFKVVPIDYAFPTHDADGDDSGREVEPADPGPGPEDSYLERETMDLALDKLPARDGEVFRMRCFEGLTSYEVAERLDCEPNAVDQAYHRAKRRLREDGLDL